MKIRQRIASLLDPAAAATAKRATHVLDVLEAGAYGIPHQHDVPNYVDEAYVQGHNRCRDLAIDMLHGRPNSDR